MINKSGIRLATHIFCIQSLLLLSLMLVIRHYNSAYIMSLSLGGFLAVAPNFLIAFFVFWEQKAIAAKRIMNRFYKAEFIKILFTMGAFAIVFNYFNIKPLIFLSSYILAQLSFLLIGFIESYFCIGINEI